MMMINGLQIAKHPLAGPVQILKIQPDILMNDDVRAAVNKWLLDMFGERENSFIIGNKAFVSEQTYDLLKRRFGGSLIWMKDGSQPGTIDRLMGVMS